MELGDNVTYFGNRDIPGLPAIVVAVHDEGNVSLNTFTLGGTQVVELCNYVNPEQDDLDFTYNFCVDKGRKLTSPDSHLAEQRATLSKIEALKAETAALEATLSNGEVK